MEEAVVSLISSLACADHPILLAVAVVVEAAAAAVSLTGCLEDVGEEGVAVEVAEVVAAAAILYNFYLGSVFQGQMITEGGVVVAVVVFLDAHQEEAAALVVVGWLTC